MAFSAFSPFPSHHFPNSYFSPIGRAIRRESSLIISAHKRSNTAPEICPVKLPSFSTDAFREKKLRDSIDDDDEIHFCHRTISPIYSGFILPPGFRKRINSASSQDSGIFSDSPSIISPDSSQLDPQLRNACTSPLDTNIIFSQARDLRIDSQHFRQSSTPEPNTLFPVPPRRAKLLSPSRCTPTHPYMLPPSRSACSLTRTFFSPTKSTPFKHPLTPLPRIRSSEQGFSSQIFDPEDPLAVSPVPVRHTLNTSQTPGTDSPTQDPALTPSPTSGSQFVPLSQTSTYYSLEDIPAISDEDSLNSTSQLTFSDAAPTRIASLLNLNAVVPRSCLSISSRSSSEESLPFHTPEKISTLPKFDTLTSKFFCHETFVSQNVVLPPIVPPRKFQPIKYIGKYRIVEQLGSGTYGYVQKGWDSEKEGFVAIKTFVNREPYRGIPQHTYREIRAFQYKSHPGLLESIEVIQTDNGPHGFPVLHLVTEFIDQDLKEYIAQYPHLLVEEKIKSIMSQLINAVSHLNWVLRIMHRDLKPANILISEQGVVKIADFGMSKHYKYMKLLTPQVVTLWYRSPEILMNCAYDYAVDVWSLGCVFAELYNKMPLFEGSCEISQLYLIISRIGLPPEDKWPADSPIRFAQFLNQNVIPLREVLPTAPLPALDAIESMLDFDPETRIRSDQIENLDFFK